jgi:hypothetical protein
MQGPLREEEKKGGLWYIFLRANVISEFSSICSLYYILILVDLLYELKQS